MQLKEKNLYKGITYLTLLGIGESMGIRDKVNRELRSGLYTLFILKSVDALGKTYGYEIIKYIERKSDGRIKMKDATVYPVLRYLDRHKILKSFWATTGSGVPRKYYALTDEGKKLLKELINDYRVLEKLAKNILEVGE